MSGFRSTGALAFSASSRSLSPLATLLSLTTLIACSDVEPVAPARTPDAPSMAASVGKAKPAKIAFVVKYLSESFAIWSGNPDGTDLVKLTSGTEADEAPAWSPDRKKIVFTRGTGAGREIMMVNATGTQLKSLGVSGFSPRWSPDGTRIIFGAYDPTAGNHNIFTMNADGSNVVRLTTDPETDGEPTFSADGQKIAFMSNRSGWYDVYVMNADGTGAQKITDCQSQAATCSAAAWSPVPGDQRILFRIGLPVNRVRVVNADGTGLTDVLGALSPLANHPAWSPDASKIAFITVMVGDAQQNVWTANFDGTGLDRVTLMEKDKRDVAWAR
jgi:Tol biopolymer transport system component